MVNAAEVQDRAYQFIRRKILAGRARSRKDLSCRQLATHLGISTIPIRIALGRLQGEGLLDSRPQSGTFIRKLTIDECLHHYDIREQLESAGAERAARQITAAQLRRLEHSCDLFHDLIVDVQNGPADPDPAAIAERSAAAEHLFHGTIMETAGNPTAAHIVENFRILRYTQFLSVWQSREDLATGFGQTEREHRSIVAALRSGHAAEAANRMKQHLKNGRARLSANLENLAQKKGIAMSKIAVFKGYKDDRVPAVPKPDKPVDPMIVTVQNGVPMLLPDCHGLVVRVVHPVNPNAPAKNMSLAMFYVPLTWSTNLAPIRQRSAMSSSKEAEP